jgi:hypothetical protein
VDLAYPSQDHLLTPFGDDGHLTLEEKNSISLIVLREETLKEHLDSSRVSLGKFLDMRRVDEILKTIVACCVLHNFVVVHESVDENEIVVDQSVS